jgi:predicted amidophosphoribosyltransferase
MPEWVDRSLDRLGALLLPPRCILCGGRGQTPLLDLCSPCEQSLPPADPPVRPGPAPLHLCCTPFEYGYPLHYLVHALKYRGELAAARVFGSLLGRRAADLGLGRAADVLLPVPLHRSRLAARGFNPSSRGSRSAGGPRCRRWGFTGQTARRTCATRSRPPRACPAAAWSSSTTS